MKRVVARHWLEYIKKWKIKIAYYIHASRMNSCMMPRHDVTKVISRLPQIGENCEKHTHDVKHR